MKKVLLTLAMFLFAFTCVTRANVQQNRADQVIEQGFEDGLGDWTMNHCHSSSGPTSSYGGNTGNYAFRFYYTANYPQYLISPELDDNDGVNFTFYAARYSSTYPETFKVGYSLTTNEPTEFTWDSEVTCTTMYGTGAYEEYSYDFPAGTKYVSIACTSNDQFYMFVDDITVTATEPAPGPTPGGLVEVTIGDPTSTTTNSYLPGYTLYDYSISQQIYTADEIGVAGTINTLTMWLKNSSSYARNINVYMKEVEATEFANATAWESFTASDMVASFTMPNENSTPIEIALPLNTPFEYSGTNNLVICFQDVTGQWSSGLGGVEMAANGNQSLYAYRDGTVYDPSNPGVNGTLLAKKNVIRLSIMTAGGGTQLDPGFYAYVGEDVQSPINLGDRPVGAWMAPYVVELAYVGEENVTVNGFAAAHDYFQTVAEVPFTLGGNNRQAVEIEMTDLAQAGEVNDTIAVLYSAERSIAFMPVIANAYEPEEGDVVENAIDLTDELPIVFTGKPAGTMYHNYNLLNAEEDAVDAVYTMTFDEDVLFTANTTGGVVYLYEEGFQGEPGPKDFNFYYNELSGTNHAINGNGQFSSSTFTEDFEGGLNGWMTIDNDNDGNNWEHSSNSATISCYTYTGFGHNASDGFAISQSYTDCTYDSYDADNYLIKAEQYEIVNGSTLSFWYDYANDSYPDYFEVVVSTTGNNASDFTAVWNSSSAKNGGNDKIRHNGTRYDNWRSIDVDLSAYAGETVWIGFHHQDYDEYELWIDDVELSVARAEQPTTPETVEYNQMFVPAGTYYVVYTGVEDVNITVEAIPAPEQVTYVRPVDGQTGYQTDWTAVWNLDAFTTEMQVLFGSVYPPTEAILDWTEDLVTEMTLPGLQNNKTYFLQVNQRNATGTTEGEIIGFTTVIDGVEDFTAEATELYPGDDAVFTWTANARSLRGYNLYMDGVLVNVDGPITETTYSVEGLEYNMTTGYDFYITALYDEGESEESNHVVVYMTGYGSVSGHVWEIDTVTPVYNAMIELRGTDEYGHDQVIAMGTTNPSGLYTNNEVLAGTYVAYGIKDGYQESNGEEFALVYQGEINDVAGFGATSILLLEDPAPLGMIKATEEENDVLVEWSWNPAAMIVDFETGDFSQAEFNLPASYPWAITTTNPHEGTYCMKSTCEGVASGTSSIQVTVDVPYEGKMGFYVRVSTESSYDKFHFYIDGTEQGQALSGQANYVYKEYAITEGTHTYKWEYAKDGSVNSNDDCVYVDDITMYRLDEPLPPTPGGTTYTFDNSTMEGWTAIDGGTPTGYGWDLASNIMGTGYGHDGSADAMVSKSYDNNYGVVYPDNYLISPSKIAAQAGAAISFYACAQDASYAAEHFGVAVSTTGNTSASDFTTIQEWTMTAKGAQGTTAESEHDIRGTRDQGNWYQYTVDLSSYAGQQIWVAIRHFNCSDQFYLVVDDITLADGSAKGNREDRTVQHFNLYRRELKDFAEEDYDQAEIELLATPNLNTFSYVDNDWNNLPYGVYQWGISATYEGNHHYAEKGRSEFETQVGEGTSTTGYFPFYTLYNYSIAENLFLASELQEAGMSASQITSLSWYATNAPGYAQQGISIWMANVDDTELTTTSHNVNDMTLVYTGSMTPAIGWNEFAFNEGSFNWDGHSNILIFCQRNNGSWNSSVQWQAGTVAFNAMSYKYQDDGAFDPTAANTMYTSTTRPNIMFKGNANGGGAAGGSNESEILWSNIIEKDMTAEVVFHVALNNDQSPVGATVTMVGPEIYDETLEADTLALTVRKGTYDVVVAMEGYEAVDTVGLLIEADAQYDIFLAEILAEVGDLYVSPTGWAMWNAYGDVIVGTTANGLNSTFGGHTGGTGGGGGGGGTGTGDTFSVNFDDSAIPTGWTTIDGGTPSGYGWQLVSNKIGTGYGHNGSADAIMSQSYDNNYGVVYPDNYLVTSQVNLAAGSTFSFYACGQDASYAAEHVGVFVSDNGTSNWTMVDEWTLSAKGTSGLVVAGRDGQMRDQGNWYLKSVDLSAYAGQKYIAIRHFNCSDQFYLLVDDIELTNGAKGGREAVRYKVELDGTYEGETTEKYWQHDVAGFVEGSEHVTRVAPVYASGMGDWSEYTWTYTPCDNFAGATDLTVTELNEEGTAVQLNWTMPEGTGGGGGGTQTPAQWYHYDTDVNADAIGTGGGNFWWGVMFPAGSYEGTKVFKTAAYDYMAMTGTVTIYNDGTTAPSTAVGTANVTLTGSEQFVEVEFAEPVSIDPTKNLWIVYYNGSGASYPAAVCANTGDANGRWVSLDGTSWEDLAGYGLDYTFQVRAFVGDVERGEVHEISVPQYAAGTGTFSNAGEAKGNREAWDLVHSFSGTSAGQQGVCTDGEYIYTVSWQTTPTGGHTFYQYDLEGNFIEGFEIAGATQIRDLTTDGEYFYGTSGGTSIYILDFATRTLVGTIDCAGLTSRHISYDPERDGFWSGNWSTLALYSRSGALIQNGAAPSSAYGSAYYKDADDVEHLYLFCQPNSDAKVYDYNIATNTISGPIFDFASTPGYNAGISGGCFIGSYDGKTCFFGNVQQDPNLIGIYELDENGGGSVTPVVDGDILGSVIMRDGEIIAVITDPTVNTYTDENIEVGEHEYCVRVIYGDTDPMDEVNTYYAMSCPVCETVITSVVENDVVDNIYPNPTRSNVTIEAQGMNHITVVSALGQVVYDADVNANMIQLNLGQYKAGLYLVRVNTVNGVSVKRITVIK